MSRKYAIQFALLAIAAVLAAVCGAIALPGQFLLIWVAVAFAVVAIAYELGRPGLLMKRESGTQPALAWLILWPYFLLARFSLFLYRFANRGKIAVAEVSPGVWFARRLTKRGMRASGVKWSAILDLAAEFPRVPSDASAYRALSILDGAMPSDAQLRDAVASASPSVLHNARPARLIRCSLRVPDSRSNGRDQNVT